MQEEVLMALQEVQDLERAEAERKSREDPAQSPKADEELASYDDLASQWPLDRVISWIVSNSFSKDWQETFKALQIYGNVFLELRFRKGGNFGMLQQHIYSRLAKESVNRGSGTRWDIELEEGKRLPQAIYPQGKAQKFPKTRQRTRQPPR
jgi:mitogen-activated protein kinase kinase kinase